MNNQIKVGFLVSYDFMYLKNSLPIVYDHVDYIALAIDVNRCTWSGGTYTITDDFFEWIDILDKEKKIHIYEDNFYIPTLTAIENDTRERTMLGKFMGEGGWHVQIDSDEYQVDFEGFIGYLKTLDCTEPTLVLLQSVTMFKQDDNGTYMVVSKEMLPIATNSPRYEGARFVYNIKEIFAPFKMLHQSWARPEQEIYYKISNWGHRDHFDIDEYFKLWSFVNKFNCRYISNFHPLTPRTWESLEYIPTTNIPKLIAIYKERDRIEKLELKQNNKLFLRDFVPPVLHGMLRKIKNRNK